MEFHILHYLLQLVFFLIVLFFYLRFTAQRKKISNGKAGFKIIGIVPEYLKNRHRLLEWSTQMLADSPTNTFVLERPGTKHCVLTANPSNVEQLLKSNFQNYPKGNRVLSLLEDFLGQGIFNVDGELWKIQRKTACYEFNTKSLRSFVMKNVDVEIKDRLMPVLESASAANQVLDLQDIFERFAFDNICKLAFNFEPKCLGSSDDENVGKVFMDAFDESSAICFDRFLAVFDSIFKIKRFLNIGSEKRLQKSVSAVHEFAENIIRSRPEKRDCSMDEDLLSRFIGHEENSPEFLRDIIISFMLAGRDTTSSALSWFFWLLSSHPQVKDKILEELQTMRSKSNKSVGQTYTFDEIRDLHYLHAAITEAMRLYPPVPFDSKAVLQDDILPDGTPVGEGWFVTFSAYAMGRMETIWGKDCKEFAPERWLEDGTFKPESPFRYPIFNAGPRLCLGKDMAYIQMKCVAAAVIERFDLGALEPPEPLLALTLRMKKGLPVRVKERLL